MLEKEEIIKNCNNEKAKILQVLEHSNLFNSFFVFLGKSKFKKSFEFLLLTNIS